MANAPELQAHWLAASRTACLRRNGRDFRDALARIPMHPHHFDRGRMRARSEAANAGALQALVHRRFAADQRRDLRVAVDENRS